MKSIQIPHKHASGNARYGVSKPVLYCEHGVFYLAAFIYSFTKQDLISGMAARPDAWVLADLKTGNVLQVYETKQKDFSDAAYDIKYDICLAESYHTSQEYYQQTFAIFDNVLDKLISTGYLDLNLYRQYLEKMLQTVPVSYQRFYRDLSI